MDEKYITYIMCTIFGKTEKDNIIFTDDAPELINECVNRLTEKEKVIIDKCAQGKNMSEIARYYNVSPSTIRWHKVKAIRKMRNPSRSRQLQALIKRN